VIVICVECWEGFRLFSLDCQDVVVVVWDVDVVRDEFLVSGLVVDVVGLVVD
jgi:hypothetical protein